jgi:hypothetical protein
MASIKDRICEAPDQTTARRIFYGSRDSWTRASGDYHWIIADSIIDAMEAYSDDPLGGDGRRPDRFVLDAWCEMSALVSWRPQMVHEFEQMYQGIIPDSIGPQDWLLSYAIPNDLISLVSALLAAGLPVRKKHIQSAKKKLLPLLLSKMDIKESDLPVLLDPRVLPYALPYLGSYATLLARHCPIHGLRNLKENGFDISDHGQMIKALNYLEYHALSTMTYLRDNTICTSDVLEVARETAWYWILYASEEERQEVLDSARSWRPLIEIMYDNGLRNYPRSQAEIWCDNHCGAFEDLVNLPAGVVRSIFHSRKFKPFPIGAVAWRDQTLRMLLEQKDELIDKPWSMLF